MSIEIVDGNVKMTLGMIWTIILRFAIQDISVEGVCSIQNNLHSTDGPTISIYASVTNNKSSLFTVNSQIHPILFPMEDSVVDISERFCL